jgi:hypothetical protein
MRGDPDDIVLWLLRLIIDRVPRVSSNVVIELEREARVAWGGKRAYVAKHRAAHAATARHSAGRGARTMAI